MTRTLTVNPGSSSLKLALVVDGRVVDRATDDRWSGALDPLAAFARTTSPDVVAVRIVHGGDRGGPTSLTPAELADLDQHSALAPLHQPAALRLARAALALLPGTAVLGCYDTSYFTALPEVAAALPLPTWLTERHHLRGRGFHGLSVAHAVRRTGDLLDRDLAELRVVVVHWGAGVSVTAVALGRPVSTSMGFSPLDGLPGATRSGSLDPALVLGLLSTGEYDLDRLRALLIRESGLAGMSGTSGDIRDLARARRGGDPSAALAIATQTRRLAREIASARACLDDLDALVFTGGVAEHHPDLCREVLHSLTHLGLPVDPPPAQEIVERGPSAAVLRLPAREELEMDRQVCAVPVVAR
ncbi:acetate kinase [Actinokineospora bangkokensis]|uniref:acetate kinase n=1 Tax=Actinokineospora bangkokensis TaxID=1193682 RepID=UPI000AC95554|nr:acetate kinase [Actinokineospora bangkokensis]